MISILIPILIPIVITVVAILYVIFPDPIFGPIDDMIALGFALSSWMIYFFLLFIGIMMPVLKILAIIFGLLFAMGWLVKNKKKLKGLFKK